MKEKAKTLTVHLALQLVIFIIIMPMLPLLITGRWGWWEAWIYALICILGFIVSRALAAKRNPGILEERAKFTQHTDAAGWDQLLARLVGLGGGLIPLVAGLDVRLQWSAAYSLPIKLMALGCMLAGYMLSAWALVENAFFSGMVRIQTERDHHVISSGPYRWVRHPGYAGAIIMYIATPIFLDASWAFIPVCLLTSVLIIRTYLEDSLLQDQLDGYAEYVRKVKYRLLPGIW